MTDLALSTPAPVRRMTTVQDKIMYARALADSGLLPAQYRKQPANLLYAVEYAEMLGTHPLTAITGIHVIEGKPSASSGLISALVRRAGHRLRVTGDTKSATAQIVRADDPEFTFSVTFTIEDAHAAGLTNKNVWKQYPASMLKARAITAVARDACEDALSGLRYTAEELGAETDDNGIPVVDGFVIPPVATTGDLVKDSLAMATDPWRGIERPVQTDQEWFGDWQDRVEDCTTVESLRHLYAEMVEKHRALQLSDHDRSIAQAQIDAALISVAADVDVDEQHDSEPAEAGVA